MVGHVSYADVAGDLSFATALASVTSPTRDFPTGPAGEDNPGDDSSPGAAGLSTTALVGVGAAALALAGILVVAVRRRRA